MGSEKPQGLPSGLSETDELDGQAKNVQGGQTEAHVVYPRSGSRGTARVLGRREPLTAQGIRGYFT